jgi:glutamate racemase
MNRGPVGIFDSGVGGLTVVDKVLRILPGENIIYFGDTARVPYGNKSKETVTRFSEEIVNFLLKFKVKLVIVACNTASSLAIDELRRSFRVPIIDVIKPGVEEALEVSVNKRIGVIGTEATVASGAYEREIRRIDRKTFVVEKPCPLFVPLAENRWFYNRITVSICREYLEPLLKKKIDTLILGCTHYPLLKNAIRKVCGRDMNLVDSSTTTARYAKTLLEKMGMLNTRKAKYARFFASDNTEKFSKLAKVFLGKEIKAKKIIF